jgi:hypothetical protein
MKQANWWKGDSKNGHSSFTFLSDQAQGRESAIGDQLTLLELIKQENWKGAKESDKNLAADEDNRAKNSDNKKGEETKQSEHGLKIPTSYMRKERKSEIDQYGNDHTVNIGGCNSSHQSNSESAGISDASTVLGWNKLALDLATGGRRGPTISSRFYALVNSSLYDSWALFDEDATCQFTKTDKTSVRSELKQLLENGNTLHGGEEDALFDAVRQVTMAIAAHDVWKSVGGSLFGPNGIPKGITTIKTGINASDITTINFDLLTTEADALVSAALQRLLGATQAGSLLYDQLYHFAVTLAEGVAKAIDDWAAIDGANQANGYADTTGYKPTPSVFNPTDTSPTIDGHWQPLIINGVAQKGLTPQWGQVATFAIADGQSLVPQKIIQPYNADGSLNPIFVDQVKEVLNLSMNLSPEMKAIAEYWEAGAGSAFPPGKWLEFTNQLIKDRGLGLDEAMKLSFSVSQALLDAGITAWATKYTYDSVRPITAIQQLFYGQNTVDGTALTDWRGIQIDGQLWQPYQNPGSPTPNFPDTPSGHSTFSSAASTVLRNLLGNNVFDKSITLKDSDSRFDVNGFDGINGSGADISLNFNYFSGAAEQAGMSRLFGGIHMMDGNWLGQIAGTQVGNQVTAKAQSLFHGEQSTEKAALQIFGTMTADILTGLSNHGGERVQEIYGFGGDDILISGGHNVCSLFGGDGLDIFELGSLKAGYIRDLQAGESILLKSEIFGASQNVSNLQLATSSLGEHFTDLLFHGNVIAHIDGNFIGSNKIQLGFTA